MSKLSNAKVPGRARPRELFRQFAWASAHPLAWAAAHPLLCAAAFFVLAFALRLLLGHWLGPIQLGVAPDEFRYMHLAKSIAEGGPLLIRGLPADYQKILYPLLISPAFLLVRDPVAQVKAIEVINCLLMASMMFPIALLVRKLTPKISVLLLTLAFSAALPDFIYTATFMCEPLYWPLCVWVFYFFHRAMAEKTPRKRLLWFALFGFFTWLAYLTKEVGAAFLIAGAAMLVIEGMREKRWKQHALALAVCVAAFFVPFLIVKQTLFAGMGNSYDGSQSGWDQVGLSGLRVPGAFGYMVYSAVALFVAAILSFYILPVLLPLFGLRELEENKRRMYWFTMVSLAVTVGAMAYTVSIREAWGEPLPRLHLRLLAPMVIPFLILCLDFLLASDYVERLKKQMSGLRKKQYIVQQKKQRRARFLAFLLTGIFICSQMVLLWDVPIKDEAIDRAAMSVFNLAQLLVEFGLERNAANLLRLAFLWFMAAVTVASVITLLAGKKKTILIMLLCAVFSLSALDNAVKYTVKKSLKLPRSVAIITDMLQEGEHVSNLKKLFFSGEQLPAPGPMAHAAISTSDYLLRTAGSECEIMVCPDIWEMLHFDTYASHRLRTTTVLPSNIRKYLEMGIKEYILDEDMGSKGWRVDYIVIAEGFNPFEHVEVVFEQSPYIVLRNFDPAKLSFSEEEAKLYG